MTWYLVLQKKVKQEYYLWQLYNTEKDITKTDEELGKERRNREEVLRELEDFEHEASKKKKEQAKYLKEIAQCEKKIAEKSNKLDKNVSNFFVGIDIFIYPEYAFFSTALSLFLF